MTVSIFPAPAKKNMPLTFSTSLTVDELAGARLEIYDMMGNLHRVITDVSPQMSIEGINMPGVYAGQLVTQNNGTAIIKIMIH